MNCRSAIFYIRVSTCIFLLSNAFPLVPWLYTPLASRCRYQKLLPCSCRFLTAGFFSEITIAIFYRLRTRVAISSSGARRWRRQRMNSRWSIVDACLHRSSTGSKCLRIVKRHFFVCRILQLHRGACEAASIWRRFLRSTEENEERIIAAAVPRIENHLVPEHVDALWVARLPHRCADPMVRGHVCA